MATYKYNPLLPKGLEEQQDAIDVTSDDVVTSEAINYVLLPGNSFGNLTGSGTIPPGTNLQALLKSALEGYLSPTFATFTLSGLSTTLEVGTQLGGNRTATWTTTNPSNITPNSVDIFDSTGSTSLALDIANDGTEAVVVPSNVLPTTGWVFTISAAPTQGSPFGRTFTVAGSYRIFFAPVSVIPTTSAQVRAFVGTSIFNTGTTTFTLNTGTTEVNFMFAIPNTAGAGNTRTLTSVIDLDAANANLTSSYLLTTFNVDDANGVGVSYKVYSLTIAVPYSSNHRHQITIV